MSRLRPHSAGSTLPHLWPTCSSSGAPPLITARYFSSNSSDAGSLRTPCPPPACAVGRQGITPAFGYSAPHPSAGGTLTLLIHALPSAHYGLLRPCAPHRYSRPRGWSRLRLLPSRRRRDGAQVLTFHTTAWSSFAPPTCRMSLGQSQASPELIPEEDAMGRRRGYCVHRR